MVLRLCPPKGFFNERARLDSTRPLPRVAGALRQAPGDLRSPGFEPRRADVSHARAGPARTIPLSPVPGRCAPRAGLEAVWRSDAHVQPRFDAVHVRHLAPAARTAA